MRSAYKVILNRTLILAAAPAFLLGTSLFAETHPGATQSQPGVDKPVVDQAGKGQAGLNHPSAAALAKVSKVSVTGGSAGVAIEITTTRAVALKSQVVTDPDRLILDFPQALPGADLHNQVINQGEVKGLRVGIFGENPPVTRVVIDLKSAQPYRIYPSGKTVLVKFNFNHSDGEQQAGAGSSGGDSNPDKEHVANVSFTPPPPPKPGPVLQVEYGNGRMSILAHDVSLAQVLSEVQRKTGADIPIPSVAGHEQIVADIGMAPVRDALTALLNGSRFNFIIVGADNDPSRLKSLILSFRSGGGISQPAVAPPPQPVVEASPDTTSQPDVPPQEATPAPENPAPENVPQPQDGPSPQ